MVNYSFRHLDESILRVFKSTVKYGFETTGICLLINVKNGYVVETPAIQEYRWIRGQHLETLKDYFKVMKPLTIVRQEY